MLTITFTQEELNVIVQSMDTAIKATGLSGARVVLPVVEKIENVARAQAAAQNERKDEGDGDVHSQV